MGHRQRARRARESTCVQNDSDHDLDNDLDVDRAHWATQNVPTSDCQNDHTATEPISAPEGERRDDVQSESIAGSQSNTQPPVESIQFDDMQVDFNEDLDDKDVTDSAPTAAYERSILTLEHEIEPEDLPDLEDGYSSSGSEASGPEQQPTGDSGAWT